VNPSVADVGAVWNLKTAGCIPVTAKSNNRRAEFSGRRRIGVFGESVNEIDVTVRL
jgi:hypothetical protein